MGALVQDPRRWALVQDPNQQHLGAMWQPHASPESFSSFLLAQAVDHRKSQGGDNFFAHAELDQCGQRFAIATLIDNGHAKASEVAASELGIPYRTLMNWTRQLAQKGGGSFYVPRAPRGSTVLTEEKGKHADRSRPPHGFSRA